MIFFGETSYLRAFRTKHDCVISFSLHSIQMVMIDFHCRVAADPDVANQVQWDRDFAIGSLAEASVHELKDYGVVFDFAAHADVLGLAASHQASSFLGTP